ncbi:MULTISPECIES: ATP-binding protein [unclassified Imperialibacter]|uniref:sensor histidine kinase n=1 Tax=unclassified Imperialibacter TaxID=2629706 RepID=UPI00125B7248|nr:MULTISPECIES: ATP-binding protein [unclassified Imperialibacter]CAD5251236.1 Sensor histidine kinase [Imperialibacter sp. 89]CAD5284259.1 Sensor histidine kinase [Imperialibacter sp. 75]VVT11037.1 Histidine kinase [Imperialibacter sp. EC-SDR9]
MDHTNSSQKNFKIDARLILQLGRESIKDHTTALIELIKNSYDADASKVEVEIFCKTPEPYVRVADNGFGMTELEIDANWLTIGFSEKRVKKRSQQGRRKAGEKGIGRIAADRLGAQMSLITKSKFDRIQGLLVNWDEFDTDNKSVSDIKLKVIESAELNIPKDQYNSTSGTELKITNLRHDWTEENISDLYRELSFFTPLFASGINFEILLKNDIDPSFSRPVKTAIYDVAEIDLTLHFDGKKELIYEFKNKINPKLNKTEIFDIQQFNTRTGIKFENYLKCGPFNLQLSFFPRKSSLLSGTDFSMTDLRSFLEQNSGVKIYRDNIAVKPYGFNAQMGQDWLGLAERKAKDPAGVSRPTYKITPNQIVGSVFISRDNNEDLKDSAAREGLVENESFMDLRAVVLGSVRLLEEYRYDLVSKEDQGGKPRDKSKSSSIEFITDTLNSLQSDLAALEKYINEKKDYKGSSLTNSINRIVEIKERAEQAFEELLDEKRTLGALATLGISSAVFGHETESAINTFKDASANALAYLQELEPEIDLAIDELKEANNQAKFIAGWGAFALGRIEREKRVKRNRKIKEIISNTIEQIKPALDALNIEVEQNLSNIYAHTYTMDIESIILNLITNSFTAVPNSDRKRKIRVDLYSEHRHDIRGLVISVADSGPGVASEYISKIWRPLFSTKVGSRGRQTGTGLGLTIVKSTAEELKGEVSVEKDDQLKGALFKVWIPRNTEE